MVFGGMLALKGKLMFTLNKYLGRFRVTYANELTDEVRANAQELIDRLKLLQSNHLPFKLGALRSGWRPKSYNTIIGGASKSRHITAQAVDVADPNRQLAKWLNSDAGILGLAECQLWCEDLEYTLGKNKNGSWVHFQTVPPASGKRFFKP